MRWGALGAGVGVLSGIASAVFLALLNWATAAHQTFPALLYGLPLAGILTSVIYARFGGAAALGNNLIIEELHQSRQAVPLRMAPLVLLSTVLTHLFGGSAGREGTAVQMGGALAERLAQVTRLSQEDRRILLMAGISGGFGSVFGTPLAGTLFGMEVQQVGRMRYEGLVPCLAAAIVGDWVTRWVGAPLGVTHSLYPVLPVVALEPLLLGKVLIASVGFGACSILFIEWTHAVSTFLSRVVGKAQWLKPALGACAVVALALALGARDYLGLSLPVLHMALEGAGVITLGFLLKLMLTGLTIGSGFKGGEVTPLFVIGATLGYTLGRLLGVPPQLMAALGFVSVFAGAANTPISCAVMGVELFGSGMFPYVLASVVGSYVFSGHRSIYAAQRLDTPKYGLDIARRLAVRDWMHTDDAAEAAYISIAARASLRDAAQVMVRQSVQVLGVVNDKGVRIGLIHADDLLRGLVAQSHLQRATPTLSAFRDEDARVRHWMHKGDVVAALNAHAMRMPATSTPAPQIRADAALIDAIKLMLAQHVDALAVVEADLEVVGILDVRAVLHALASRA